MKLVHSVPAAGVSATASFGTSVAGGAAAQDSTLLAQAIVPVLPVHQILCIPGAVSATVAGAVSVATAGSIAACSVVVVSSAEAGAPSPAMSAGLSSVGFTSVTLLFLSNLFLMSS